MSHPASSPFPAAPAEGGIPPAQKSRLTAFLTAIGAIVLIGSEIWLAAIASIWALDGMLGLSTVGDLVMIAIVGPIALWATWAIAKLAIAAELNPENTD